MHYDVIVLIGATASPADNSTPETADKPEVKEEKKTEAEDKPPSNEPPAKSVLVSFSFSPMVCALVLCCGPDDSLA